MRSEQSPAGALGVIASLIYVGISFRHSAEVVRGESLQKFIDARVESIDKLSAPGNVEIYHRGRESYLSSSQNRIGACSRVVIFDRLGALAGAHPPIRVHP